MLVPIAPWIALLAPLPPLVVALLILRRPGRRPGRLPLIAEWSMAATFAIALLGLVQSVLFGPVRLSLGQGLAELTLRLDRPGAITCLFVSLVGWIVVRFGRTYLDGEEREGLFHALTLAALSASLLFALAGSAALVLAALFAISSILRRLLLFYPQRRQAQRAAAKFVLVWRAADVALAAAILLLWISLGTLDLDSMAARARAETGLLLHLGAGLVVLSALLRSAAFPFHGWITDVMEAPTPVSALLHAGVVNAGGLLLVHFAQVVQVSPASTGTLVLVGGFTALFGGLVMLTQPAVKTALAWSTISQMGFMLLQCGLGLWPLALLHIAAHSLYKAHAFLSSGNAVRTVAFARRLGPVAVPSGRAAWRSLLFAVGLYIGIAAITVTLFGPKSPQELTLGVILIFGVSYLVAQGMADAAPGALTRRMLGASVGVSVAYFTFHVLARTFWGGTLPAPPTPSPLDWALMVLVLLSFAVAAVAQALSPLWMHHPAVAGLRVHLLNGLYINALFDRLLLGLRLPARA